MKYKAIEILVLLLATIIIMYFVPIKSVVAENGIPLKRSLDSEIVRLAKQYVVSEDKARKIIKCESSNKPNAININLNKTIDYSYWQINEYWWGEELKSKGWDIKDPDQNLEAGFYLLSKYGDKLWYLSAKCWASK